jgi:hypothetical protein
VQQAIVLEPRTQALGPEGVGAKDVGDETQPLARLGEQALQTLGKLGLVGNGNSEPTSPAARSGVVMARRLGAHRPDRRAQR